MSRIILAHPKGTVIKKYPIQKAKYQSYISKLKKKKLRLKKKKKPKPALICVTIKLIIRH